MIGLEPTEIEKEQHYMAFFDTKKADKGKAIMVDDDDEGGGELPQLERAAISKQVRKDPSSSTHATLDAIMEKLSQMEANQAEKFREIESNHAKLIRQQEEIREEFKAILYLLRRSPSVQRFNTPTQGENVSATPITVNTSKTSSDNYNEVLGNLDFDGIVAIAQEQAKNAREMKEQNLEVSCMY